METIFTIKFNKELKFNEIEKFIANTLVFADKINSEVSFVSGKIMISSKDDLPAQKKCSFCGNGIPLLADNCYHCKAGTGA